MTDSGNPLCISVVNMKGGVGKTTIAALLGRYAARKLGRKVLAIDLDPQANLSQAFMRQRYKKFLDDGSPSIVELFQGYRSPGQGASAPSSLCLKDILVRRTDLGGPNLQLIPSRFDFSEHLVQSVGSDPRVLARCIAQECRDRDIIIIDCAPTESILTQAAYHASRYVLVPVKPEYFATIGFPLLKKSLDMFKRRNPSHSIDMAGIVINNATYHYSGNKGGPERKQAIRELQKEADPNGWRIFTEQIPFSRGFPKMMRGDLRHLGDAREFRYFAKQFFGAVNVAS